MISFILFTTSTCQYCGPIAKMLEEFTLADGDLDYKKWVVDEDSTGMDLAMQWGINSVPTILLMHEGNERARFVGAKVTKEELARHVERYLARDMNDEGAIQPNLFSE